MAPASGTLTDRLTTNLWAVGDGDSDIVLLEGLTGVGRKEN
jgi:hypothetical protein